ncbi:MAG: hypothetical protein QNJ46_10125, partial [Leptolyngbyaceae cyanobacterium MO_188.B28]|nr:hypothetical protein [Leptolyngbyaceae cyanobacterium MO_188.B28]
APVAFADSMMEPAFDTKNLSFCIWLMEGSSDWCMGNVDFPTVSDPDGSGMLLAILDGQPATYQVWAAEYYECAVGLEAIEAIYHQSPLTEELVQTFNPDLTFSDLGEDLLEIGYP